MFYIKTHVVERSFWHLWEFDLHIDGVCRGGDDRGGNFLPDVPLVLLGEAEEESHARDVVLKSGGEK